MNWEEKKKEFFDRRHEIYERNKNGESYSKLAREYDVTASRIGAIVKKQRKHEAQVTEG